MSARSINKDMIEPIVWTVHGVNWDANVAMDEMNASFPADVQAQEAASKAVDAFKGRQNGVDIHLDEGEDTPKLGTMMIVALKGEDPNKKGILIFTFLALADNGYYEDADKVAKELAAQIEQMKKEQKASPLVENALKQLPKPRKPRKPRKPKDPPTAPPTAPPSE